MREIVYEATGYDDEDTKAEFQHREIVKFQGQVFDVNILSFDSSRQPKPETPELDSGPFAKMLQQVMPKCARCDKPVRASKVNVDVWKSGDGWTRLICDMKHRFVDEQSVDALVEECLVIGMKIQGLVR